MVDLTFAVVSPPTSTRISIQDPPPRHQRHHIAAFPRPPCPRFPALCSLGLPPATVPRSGGGRWRRALAACTLSSSSPGGDEGVAEEGRGMGNDDLERALAMDGSIPGSSQEFTRWVSSCAYDMRRNLM